MIPLRAELNIIGITDSSIYIYTCIMDSTSKHARTPQIPSGVPVSHDRIWWLSPPMKEELVGGGDPCSVLTTVRCDFECAIDKKSLTIHEKYTSCAYIF